MSTLNEEAGKGKEHARWKGTANGADHTRSESLLTFAHDAVALGICVLPTMIEAKRPGFQHVGMEWEQYQQRLPILQELAPWFPPRQEGIGLVTGKVSGNVEALDCDRYEIFLTFGNIMRGIGQDLLLDRLLAGYQDRSPRGAHTLWRCETIEKNLSLATRYDLDAHGNIQRNAKGKALTKGLIETRGEGGYLVIPPSHGRTHPSGEPYVQVSGGLSTIATISPEERKIILDVARSLTEVQDDKKQEKTDHTQHKENGGTRPGDIFNARATWEEILEPHGWVKVYDHAGKGYWRRPGKERGISATTNYADSDFLYVFSTSTDFESERGYSKFSAFTLLNHNGDFEKAAADLLRKGYGSNGNGTSHTFDMGDDDEAETEEEENDRVMKEERPVEDKWPCPAHLWRGPFALVAAAMGKQTWEVWTATLVALGAKAHRNIAYKYHRMLFGMVYALLIKGTGMGKGLSTDLCRGLMPDWYLIRDAVQSGPALAPLLADIVRGQKGKVESCTPHPALLLIEEFTVLLKNAGIQHSTLIDSLNSLFHRPWPWNISRSDRPNSGGGDVVIKDPTLSILATTTEALFKEYVSPQMIRSGFLNRYIVLPGDSTPWKFYDPEGAGNIIHQNLGLFDHIPMRKVGDGQTVWEAYEPPAFDRLKSWGEETFEPIMQSSELEAESVKRLHVYAHVIGLLYAWGDQRDVVKIDDVECSISVIETSQRFLQALITEDREPDVPKFKAYEMSLEQRILAKVTEAAERGARRRSVVRALQRHATTPDLYAFITNMVRVGTLCEVAEKTEGAKKPAHKLYLPEHNPERKKRQRNES